MTQFVDFVALGWVEQSLRGEIEAARKCLYHFQREPEKTAYLQEAECNIHSATSALKLPNLYYIGNLSWYDTTVRLSKLK